MTNFARSLSLNNIPDKKLQSYLDNINNSQDDLQTKSIKTTAINRFAESSIPIEYWNFRMEKDFKGDPRLLAKYLEYIQDINSSYSSGSSICFAGNVGVGKTTVMTNILKKACLKGFSCQYTTLSDVVSILTSSNSDDKFIARKELIMVDFLVLDEVDTRYISSDSSSDLFARTLEGILRTRCQNKLPILMSTNSPNLVEVFSGSLKIAIDSLMKGYIKMFPVFGNDFRKMPK